MSDRKNISNLRNLSDDELLELFDQNHIAAFEEIYNRYWQRLYAAAYNRLRDKEAAKEITQDLFAGFWINRDQLKIHSTLEGYLLTSVKYSVLNYLRAQSVRLAYSEILMLASNNYDNSTEQYINCKELSESVSAEIKNLPPKCRSVFELSRNEYKTNKEIARQLDISEKTVENHINKALRYLRVSLDTRSLFIVLASIFLRR